jgi:hypothetical protein
LACLRRFDQHPRLGWPANDVRGRLETGTDACGAWPTTY